MKITTRQEYHDALLRLKQTHDQRHPQTPAELEELKEAIRAYQRILYGDLTRLTN